MVTMWRSDGCLSAWFVDVRLKHWIHRHNFLMETPCSRGGRSGKAKRPEGYSVVTARALWSLWEHNMRLGELMMAIREGAHSRGEGRVGAGFNSADDCSPLNVLDCCNSFSLLCNDGGKIVDVPLKNWNRQPWERS